MRFGTGVCGGEPLVELLLDDSGGVAGLGRPGGSQITRLDLGGGTPHLDVGDQLGRQDSIGPGRRPGWCSGGGVAADWSARRATSCARAFRHGPQFGSAASRSGMPSSHGNGPRRRPR